MNDNDIIRMAKEASGHDFVGPRTIEFAERFAALVTAAEREACAKLAGPHLGGEIAAAIRARGEQEQPR